MRTSYDGACMCDSSAADGRATSGSRGAGQGQSGQIAQQPRTSSFMGMEGV